MVTSLTNLDGSRWVYTYDALGQVTGGKKYWADGAPVAGQQFEYAFDTIGNRQTAASGGDADGTSLRPQGYSVNTLNQYTSRTVPGFVNSGLAPVWWTSGAGADRVNRIVKTRMIPIVMALFGLMAVCQDAQAFYNPSTGRWLSRDPLCNRPVIPPKDVVFRELSYVFARNEGIGWIDPLGLWEGAFGVRNYNVVLNGKDARERNIPDGDTVPGFTVRYYPDKKNCSCPKDKIVLIQVISHDSNAVPGKDPKVDSSDSGSLPGAYTGSRNGNLQIFDAPWNNWPAETTYTIEDCAVCRDGKKNPETILGCVKFTWTKNGHQLNPEGAISAAGPSQMWNDGVAGWIATHPGGN